MNSEVISHCVGPLSKNYLSKCPHHVTPCVNLHTKPHSDNAARWPTLKPFPFSSSMPIPLTPPTALDREIANGIDPTTVLIRDKIKWQTHKDNLVKAVRRDTKKIPKEVLKKARETPVGNDAVVPETVALLAHHLDGDPDPYFSGCCNWYYTGGSLAVTRHNGDHFLLHANHSHLNCSRIVDENKTKLSSSQQLEDNEQICQIVTTRSDIVAVRQETCVTILSCAMSEEGNIGLEEKWMVFDKKHKFVSTAVAKGCHGKLATISNTKVLKLWDIEYSKQYTQKCQVEPKGHVFVNDNWSSLHYVDENTLLLADRCCLHILDVREGLREKKLAWCSKDLLEMCEEQCNIVPSGVSKRQIYTATTHQLLCLDLRRGFSQRWTHLMTSPPHLAFAHRAINNLEVVCLGSQLMADCVVIVNTWCDRQGQSLYRPTGIPSPGQSLHSARRHAICLEPSFTQRCTQSMTGLACLPGDKGVTILRQSATGDVFMQELSTSETFGDQLSEYELAAYNEWSQPLDVSPKLSSLTTVTSIVDNHLLLTDKFVIKEQETSVEENTSAMYSTCQMSKQYMEDCVDLLAGKLFAVWQVEDEEEWLEEEPSFSQVDAGEKVMNWLQEADILDNTAEQGSVVATEPLPQETTRDASPPLSICVATRSATPQNQSYPSPWMTQPSHVLQLNQTSNIESHGPFFSQHAMFSPTHSSSSKRKKIKLSQDDILTTPKRTPSTKPSSVQKKKFVPGF